MARDLFHNIVRSALEKDGWTITNDPLNIRCGGVDIQIDLGAERLLAAEKAGEKIAVEIKRLKVKISLAPRRFHKFHMALGLGKNLEKSASLR